MFPFEIRKISCGIACEDPEGGYGVRPPWKVTSYMGFYRNYPLDPPPSMEKVALPP